MISIDKLISYGLIDKKSETLLTVQQMSEAVTHACFVETNSSCSENLLMKILQVRHLVIFS